MCISVLFVDQCTLQSPVAASHGPVPVPSNSVRPFTDQWCGSSVGDACGSLPIPTIDTSSSQLRLKSGLSQRTVDRPPTDTSSGISSLYAMDVENGTSVDDFPEIGSVHAPRVGATRSAG